MSNLNSLLESSNQWKSMQSDAARLAGKWAKTGLLEGLKSETEKNNMSLILENQAKQLVVESSQTGGGAGSTAAFAGGQGEQWAGIALPLVRKVFGTIVAKEFVSVHPMTFPSGLVFFLDFQYGNTKNPFSTGESLYGNRDSGSRFPFQTLNSNLGLDNDGGLYGAGKFAYSTNQFSQSYASGSAAAEARYAAATWADVQFNGELSQSVVDGE